MIIEAWMLASWEEAMLKYATMSPEERRAETGILARLCIAKHGSPPTKELLRKWHFNHQAPEARSASKEAKLVVVTTSGYSTEPGCE